MSKTVAAGILYALLILAISSAIVTLSHTLHTDHQVTSPDTGVAKKNDRHVVDFFQTGDAFTLLKINRITENEVRHMFDVRRLLIIGAFATLAMAIALLVLWESIQAKLAIFLTPFVMMWQIVPQLLLVPFDKLFLWFHEVLFPQGNYTFPIDAALIITYPPEFFIGMGLLIAKFFFFISLGMLFLKLISDVLYTPVQRLKARVFGR